MRLWREYIFEVCQSKLYQPTTAGSNPLQGDTYPVGALLPEDLVFEMETLQIIHNGSAFIVRQTITLH